MKKIAENIVQAILFFGGIGSISIGVWLIYHPAGYIVGGLFAIGIAFLLPE